MFVAYRTMGVRTKALLPSTHHPLYRSHRTDYQSCPSHQFNFLTLKNEKVSNGKKVSVMKKSRSELEFWRRRRRRRRQWRRQRRRQRRPQRRHQRRGRQPPYERKLFFKMSKDFFGWWSKAKKSNWILNKWSSKDFKKRDKIRIRIHCSKKVKFFSLLDLWLVELV